MQVVGAPVSIEALLRVERQARELIPVVDMVCCLSSKRLISMVSIDTAAVQTPRVIR